MGRFGEDVFTIVEPSEVHWQLGATRIPGKKFQGIPTQNRDPLKIKTLLKMATPKNMKTPLNLDPSR